MDLNWLQSIIYGFVSGLMDILPVSAQAHRALLLKLFGVLISRYGYGAMFLTWAVLCASGILLMLKKDSK